MAATKLARRPTPSVSRGPSPALLKLRENVAAAARRTRAAAQDRQGLIVQAIAGAAVGYLDASGTLEKINPLPVDSTLILAGLAFVPGKGKAMKMVQEAGAACAVIAAYKLGAGDMFGASTEGVGAYGSDWQPAV